MEISSEEREQVAIRSLATAAEWRRKNDRRRELSVLSSAVENLLGVAVERFPDAAAGTRFLTDRDVARTLDRMAELNALLFDALRRETKPTSGAVDNDITPVHVAWLLCDWDAARSILAVCSDQLVRKFFPLTPFWVEYCRALESLEAGKSYEPMIPRLRGYERNWVPHLKLIADLTNGRPVAGSRAEIAESFKERNRDKRLIDWRIIDGDGKHPVRWDFREASILRFAEYRHLTKD